MTAEILSAQAEPFNKGELPYIAYCEGCGEKMMVNKKYKSIQTKKAVTGGCLKDGVTPLGQRTTMAVDFIALNLGSPPSISAMQRLSFLFYKYRRLEAKNDNYIHRTGKCYRNKLILYTCM